MAERFIIEIGDKVKIGKEQKFLTVVNINEQTVQIGENKVVLNQLYFKEKHQPEFDWRVKQVKGKEKE